MDKITAKVNGLYERYPYPQLPLRSFGDLTGRLHANVMRRILATAGLSADDLAGKRVLDAGCGTGEKSCYFRAHGAEVVGIDLCSSSLKMSRQLADRFGLAVEFRKQDVLALNAPGGYDHVFSLGVLHHTPDPYKGFCNVAGACRKGGTVTVGLYNSYGRFLHRLRRFWIGLNCGDDVGKRMGFVKGRLFGREFRSGHEEAFAADKYANPHESYHTVGEVLGWFERNGLDFLGACPAVGRLPVFDQLRWLVRGQGFFVVSGKKL